MNQWGLQACGFELIPSVGICVSKGEPIDLWIWIKSSEFMSVWACGFELIPSVEICVSKGEPIKKKKKNRFMNMDQI